MNLFKKQKHMEKYKILFFITAFSQIISTFFTSFSGGSNFNELLITPAGYTFSIWGIITLFSTIFAFWHLFFDKHIFSKKFYLLLSLVYTCFTLWLIAAQSEFLFLTLIIFISMYIALLEVVLEASTQFKKNLWNKIFLQGSISMYLAWSSIAVLINLGVYLFSFGIKNISQTGIILQIIIVTLATVSATYALIKSKFNKVVFATHWWAFIGVIIGLLSRDNTQVLLISTIVLVILFNIFYFKNKRN